MGCCFSTTSSKTQPVLEVAPTNLASKAAVGARLSEALHKINATLGEAPLPMNQALPLIKQATDETVKMRETDPWVVCMEAKQSGATPLDAPDSIGSQDLIRELARYVHHASLAYESSTDKIRATLKQSGLVLLEHSTTVLPGKVAHYMAFDPAQKLAVLSIKGTSTFDDIITDVLADTEPLDLAGKEEEVWAHSGFATAARGVVADTEMLVQHLLASQGYKIIVTGHSLGAGTACLVSMMFRSKGIDNLQCYAYATPPCLTCDKSLGCASYITSVVYNDDVVGRASVRNIKLMGHTLRDLREVHKSKDPDIRVILQKQEGNLQIEAKDDLFVAGQVVFVYFEGGKYDAVLKDGTLTNLRRIELTPNCATDHLLGAYIPALENVAARLTNTKPGAHAPWPAEAKPGTE